MAVKPRVMTYKMKTNKKVYETSVTIFDTQTTDEAALESGIDHMQQLWTQTLLRYGEEFEKWWVENQDGNILRESTELLLKVKGK